MELLGIFNYGVVFCILAGCYAILALGLNLQWGYAGMLNVGVAAFFAVGAYASAIVTTSEPVGSLGTFGWPLPLGFLAAAIVSGVIAFLVGLVTLRLRADYLAIATIGIAEIIRLVVKTEEWLANGVLGIKGVPNRLQPYVEGGDNLAYLGLVVALVALLYWLLARAYRSPWGRALRAIRDNETAARAMGKNAAVFRLQAFVIGSAFMGLAGALYVHFVGFVSPETFDPLLNTFLVWVMLIAGGSGNALGAVLGAFVIWAFWSGSEILAGWLFASTEAAKIANLRILLIGILLEVVLLLRPQGLLPQRPPKPLPPPLPSPPPEPRP